MSQMQVFRSQLHSKDEVRKPYLQALLQLTQANLKQMKALEGAPSWEGWGIAENQSPKKDWLGAIPASFRKEKDGYLHENLELFV